MRGLGGLVGDLEPQGHLHAEGLRPVQQWVVRVEVGGEAGDRGRRGRRAALGSDRLSPRFSVALLF